MFFIKIFNIQTPRSVIFSKYAPTLHLLIYNFSCN